MDEAGARTVARSVAALYRDVHEKLREQVRGLDHGTLNWSPLPKANSVAVLVTHTLGSEREMLRALRMIPTERDRDSEFKVEAEAADLLALLDEADRDVEEHLGAVTAADLTELRPRGDRPPRPGIEWLLSNYGHAREHLAQIELTKQLYDSRT
ncbi:MAG TPA: DinB family protein [Candidatus Limnocylindrales bacterium]|nr:DinB family protein [Candidatus Limnocylindrales bacterium]